MVHHHENDPIMNYDTCCYLLSFPHKVKIALHHPPIGAELEF